MRQLPRLRDRGGEFDEEDDGGLHQVGLLRLLGDTWAAAANPQLRALNAHAKYFLRTAVEPATDEIENAYDDEST